MPFWFTTLPDNIDLTAVKSTRDLRNYPIPIDDKAEKVKSFEKE
jgi:hypothetical protein